MKMGLSVILVGHVNFLLGALVHGVVLRHISIKNQDRTMQYAIANVVAIASGMLVSILALTRIELEDISVEGILGNLIFINNCINPTVANLARRSLLCLKHSNIQTNT